MICVLLCSLVVFCLCIWEMMFEMVVVFCSLKVVLLVVLVVLVSLVFMVVFLFCIGFSVNMCMFWDVV